MIIQTSKDQLIKNGEQVNIHMATESSAINGANPLSNWLIIILADQINYSSI
jgi:hypothetical protein